MKRILRYFLFLGIVALPLVFANFALAQTTEQITEFNSKIELQQNTDILVEEQITYFFPTEKHGMYRDIPVRYSVQGGFGRPITVKLTDLYYFNKNNPSLRYSINEKSTSNGYVRFKIGDPDSTITGEYVFVIKYTIKNAVNYFDDHDELYLNITGDGWTVPIMKVTADIKLPGNIDKSICYTGPNGSTLSNCSFSNTSDTQTVLTTTKFLNVSEGLTAVVAMPKGTLKDVRGAQTIAFLLTNIGILLPIPTLILGIYLLKKSGKNKKITVIPNYDPPKNMFPLLAGSIYTKSLNPKHITAQIIQMALDGYIKIKQEGKRNYTLEKDNIEKEIKEESVKTLYADLFKGKDSLNIRSLPNDFYRTVNTLKKDIDGKLYSDLYFSKTRKSLWKKFFYIGLFGIFLTFVISTPLALVAATGWTIGIVISSIILIILTTQIDFRDTLGNEIYYELQGLKMYINTAEKYRIEFHNDPKKYIGIFEKLLPYAIIFGLEKKWAKEFEDLYTEPPSWYQGDMSTFNTVLLMNSISTVSRSVQTSSAPPSSQGASGGSGFSGGSSGGGFGGGGGGSW